MQPLRTTSSLATRRNSSLANRLDRLTDPQEVKKPPMGAMPQPPLSQIVRQHAAEYAFLLATLVLLAFSERWEPFKRNFYNGTTSDMDLWKYSYPLKDNHVPAWAVPCVAVFTPLLAILAFLLAGRILRAEAHHACLVAISCVALTGLLTNWIKINVGRPRPHFVHRCWPNGLKPVFSPDGLPLCADTAINPGEGIKSFPSGHTSWSTSGLGYLTFWLLGKLRVFADGAAAPSHFVASIAPLMGAVWIGMSRVQDFWHHVEDVCAGFTLGLLLAYLYYRQIYAGVMSAHAGMLTAAVRSSSGALTGGNNGSRGTLSTTPSRHALTYGSGVGLGEGEDAHMPLPLYGDDRV